MFQKSWYNRLMPPYPPRNLSGIFSLFSSDSRDRLTRIFQAIGTAAFTIALAGCVFAGTASRIVSSHSRLPEIVGGCAGVGFLVGVFMFIGAGARVIGRQNGVHSFASQIFRVLWRTFVFLLLPLLILTILLVVFLMPKN